MVLVAINLLEPSALHAEARVVSAKDGSEHAVAGTLGVGRAGVHRLDLGLELVVGLAEHVLDEGSILRTARDVIGGVIRVNDGEPVRVSVGNVRNSVLRSRVSNTTKGARRHGTCLGNILGRVDRNGCLSVVELVPVQIQELQEELAEMVPRLHGAG